MKYRIGQFSALSKVSEKTLRYYDRIGLLKPKSVDGWNRYRYYSTEQLGSIQTIIAFREAGLSIEEIKSMFEGRSSETMLEDRMEDLLKRRDDLDASIRSLEKMIAEKNSYKVKMKDLPSYIVYSRTGVIPTRDDMGSFVMEAGAMCLEANPDIGCIEPGYCFITYANDCFEETDVELTYSEAVPSMGKETDEIKFRELKPVTVAYVEHRGPYSKIRMAYAAVMEFMEENGYEMADSPREWYIDGCWNKESEEDYLTEVQIPVKKTES